VDRAVPVLIGREAALTGRLLIGARPRFVVHPIVLAVAYVLNQGLSTEAEFAGMVRPLLVAALFALVLSLAGWAAFRNRWDGGLLATFVILSFIVPFPASRMLQLFDPAIGLFVAALVLIMALGYLAVRILRARRQRTRLPRPSAGALNAFAAILVGVVVVSNAAGHIPTAIAQATTPATTVDVGLADSTSPDIVVILLDGYPRSDVLQRRLGIDNAAFLGALRDRGFDVAADSHSNYVFTALTLASMFQMRHIDQIASLRPLIGTGLASHDALRDAATGGLAFAALRSAGYEIVTAPPGWQHVTLAAAADRVLDDGEMTDLERSLLEQTWLLDLLTLTDSQMITAQLRDRLVHAFDHLDTFAAERRDRPAFLFVHVPGPHPPLVVDASGKTLPVPARGLGADDPAGMHMTQAEYSATWAGELAYLERRVLQAVDALQATDNPPVIVVMADHGYIQEVRADDVQARFSNLFAAYTPGAPGLLKDPPTLVNLMPRLLNHYLGADFPLSADRFFLSPGPLQPLMLTEVTDPEAAPAVP
jgi:hypothetical protein